MSIMGCVSSRPQDEYFPLCMPTKEMFLFKDVVGKGGFGKVVSALVRIQSLTHSLSHSLTHFPVNQRQKMVCNQIYKQEGAVTALHRGRDDHR